MTQKTNVDCNISTACNAFMSGASNVKLHWQVTGVFISWLQYYKNTVVF